MQEGSEERGGMGFSAGGNHLRGAGGDQLASVLSRFGAEVENPICVFDDVEVMFDNQERVSLVDQPVQKRDEEPDIVEMQTGGGLVEDQEGGTVGEFFSASTPPRFFAGRRGLGEMGDQFETLSFSAGKLAEGLAATEVAETDLGEKLEGSADLLMTFARPRREVLRRGVKGESLGGCHVEELVDGFAAVGGGEDVGLKAAAFAGGAGDKDIRKELHGDLFVAHAPAALTAAASGIKREGGSG
jgi:hypothetical protein